MKESIIMNVKKKNEVKRHIKVNSILAIVCFLPFLFSFFFQDTFRLWNTQVNDQFFKLRFLIKGSEKISPVFYLFTITDSFDRKYAVNQVDRTIYATALKKLYSANIKTILWDIIFSDERTGNTNLVDVTRKSGNIFYPFYFNRRTGGKGSGEISPLIKNTLFIPAFQKSKGNPHYVQLDTIHYPFHALSLAAAGLGFSNADPDKDGIKRTIPLFYKSDQGYVPSLVLTGVCDYFQVNTSNIEIHYGEYIKLPDAQYYGIKKELIIPIDKKGQMIINFPGPVRESITQYPLDKVMEAMMGEENELSGLIENTLVLVGDTSTRGKDFGRGIFDPVYPNSFMLGSAINTILTENYLTASYPAKNCILFILVLSLISLFWFIFNNRDSRGFLFFLLLFFPAIILLILGVNFWFFIILNNLSLTVELLLGVICAVLILLIFKLLAFQDEQKPKPDVPESVESGINVPNGTFGKREPVISTTIYDEHAMERVLNAMGIFNKRYIKTAWLLFQGFTYQEIESTLNMALPTVKKYVRIIYDKCEVPHKRAKFIKKVINHPLFSRKGNT